MKSSLVLATLGVFALVAPAFAEVAQPQTPPAAATPPAATPGTVLPGGALPVGAATNIVFLAPALAGALGVAALAGGGGGGTNSTTSTTN